MNIVKNAMLIRLNISQWSARKQDKTASLSVYEKYNVESTMGKFTKGLVSKEHLKEVKKIANAARNYYYENTLPWSKDGNRLLPSKNYMEFSKEMSKYKREFEEGIENLKINYQNFIKDAECKLGTLFNPSDYPDEITKYYEFTVDINPVPTSNDFRINLNNEEIEKIQQFIEKRTKAQIEAVNNDLWQRFYKAINNIITKLSDPNAIFRDSLIGNLNNLIDLLPKLNITEDTDLITLTNTAKNKLGNLNVTNLRTKPEARIEANNIAKEILLDMENKITFANVKS